MFAAVVEELSSPATTDPATELGALTRRRRARSLLACLSVSNRLVSSHADTLNFVFSCLPSTSSLEGRLSITSQLTYYSIYAIGSADGGTLRSLTYIILVKLFQKMSGQ